MIDWAAYLVEFINSKLMGPLSIIDNHIVNYIAFKHSMRLRTLLFLLGLIRIPGFCKSYMYTLKLSNQMLIFKHDIEYSSYDLLYSTVLGLRLYSYGAMAV